jgi:hypothetical protein
MTVTDAIEISAAILASLGGGAIVLIACSSWLGKLWAERIMERERADYAKELEKLRSELNREVETDLELWKKKLDVSATTTLREVSDKLAIYRATVDLVAEVLGDFDRVFTDGGQIPDLPARLDRFNRQRIKAYGYMAMLAPQSVMDAFDNLADHLLLIANGEQPYVWTEVRNRSIALLNEIRKDVGLDKRPIEYRGSL